MAPLEKNEVKEQIDYFITRLQLGQLESPYEIAQQAVFIFRKIISCGKWSTARDLLELVKDEGNKLINAQPSESTIRNIVRKVLKIIRDEYDSEQGKPQSEKEFLQQILKREEPETYSKEFPALRQTIMEAIGEFCTELETNIENIAVLSLEHIHSDEVILTFGGCPAVEAFLKRAAEKKREFKVMVVEGAPSKKSHSLANNLAEVGIDVTVITDSAVCGIMSTVNKVIIGAQTVMANGGLKVYSGVNNIALAAQKHSVPLIVCVSMFMVSSEYYSANDQEGFNTFLDTREVVPLSEGDIVSQPHVYSGVCDYIPPDRVTLYITNNGCKDPSYVYRMLQESCHPDDYDL